MASGHVKLCQDTCSVKELLTGSTILKRRPAHTQAARRVRLPSPPPTPILARRIRPSAHPATRSTRRITRHEVGLRDAIIQPTPRPLRDDPRRGGFLKKMGFAS